MRPVSTMDRLKLRFQYPKQVREAAAQFWDACQRGMVFEVPLALDVNDPSMQALWLCQRLHPEISLGVRQSRSIIVSRQDRHDLSPEVKELLKKGGQFTNPEEFISDLGRMLQGHETFLRRQGFDPEVQVAEAKEAEMKKHALGEVAGDGSPVVAPTEQAKLDEKLGDTDMATALKPEPVK